MHFAHLFERQRFPVVALPRTLLAVLQLFRQVRQIDEVSRCRDARAGDDILQFAHIARPAVSQQYGLRPPRQPENILSISGVVFLQEKLHQQRYIFQPLGQRGNADLYGAQPVKQIFAKASRQHLRAQIPVCSGDQPNVDVPYFGRPDSLNLAVLNHAQQLRLHRHGSFSHFVQEHGSAVGILEQARPRVRGPGKCPAHVPEELAVQQCVHHCGTVAHCQLLLARRADLVDGSGDQLFARSRRSHQQDIGIVAGDLSSKIKYFQHRWAFPHDAVKFQVL